MSKALSSSGCRQAVTQAIVRFGRTTLIACLILVADTVAADQSAVPRITAKEIQSVVAKNIINTVELAMHGLQGKRLSSFSRR